MNNYKGKILIDTILYNPLYYVYNVNLKDGTGLLYDELRNMVIRGEIVETPTGKALKIVVPDDKRKREYYHLDYMFEITEKSWL